MKPDHTATRTDSAGVAADDPVALFHHRFGGEPAFAVRAPGRVNLIGEHTDYNDGFCLPMAIDRAVRIVARRRDDDQVRVASCQEPEMDSFTLATPIPRAGRDAAWSDYVRGCAATLLADGTALRGCDLAISGDVPLGSGLSSSAALEVATMHALLQVAGVAMPPTAIATAAQRAENDFVGTRCGILDQLASSCSRAGQVMLMDCRSLALSWAPLPAEAAIVIADTGRRRGLVDSAYNERRAQCEAGARALGVSHLRDVELHGLRAALADGRIDELTWRRCAHVVAENGRTLAAAACLRAGDLPALGALMDQSHADLRDRFEVTCTELDDMVRIARSLPGCLGSRMTGAGFGGCTVSLVHAVAAEDFVRALTETYTGRHDLPMAAYVTGAAAGAGILEAPWSP